MICKNCGYILEGEPTYCTNCGTILDKTMEHKNTAQNPPIQGATYQGASNQGSPNHIPSSQSPQYQGSSQGPQYQGPQYQGQQYQGQQYQGSQYQGSSNQRPPYQQSPGALPPPVPLYMQVPPRKNPALIPILIISIILLVLFAGSIITFTVLGIVDAASESDMDQLADKYGLDSNENFSDAFEGFDDFGYSYDEFDIQEEIYQNYDTFIQGRELLYYDQYTEVVMENGIGFYLNDIVVTDLGDGTAAIDANVDLASYATDNYLYNEDFLMLPMDKAGNALADACSVEYIMDSSGNAISTPMLLDTEEYKNYTISFLVPTDTQTFNVYGANYSADGFSGPVYYTEMQVDE